MGDIVFLALRGPGPLVPGSGSRVPGFRVPVLGCGSRVPGSNLRVQGVGLGFRSGSRVPGPGFPAWVPGPAGPGIVIVVAAAAAAAAAGLVVAVVSFSCFVAVLVVNLESDPVPGDPGPGCPGSTGWGGVPDWRREKAILWAVGAMAGRWQFPPSTVSTTLHRRPHTAN